MTAFKGQFFADLDRASLIWIGKKRSRAVIEFLKIITYSGAGKTWVAVAIVLNILQVSHVTIVPDQTLFLRAMLCALLAWAAGRLLKRIVGRKRPSEQISDFLPAIQTPSCGSFPSSHAAAAFAFSLALCFLHHEWTTGVMIWACLVVFSRFYLGVHFITDLVGGIALSALCALAIFPITAAI